MKKLLGNQKLILLSRIVLGGLFIYASYDKILNPLAFAQIVHHYRMAPPNFINIWAIILPWIEFLAGILLIAGYRLKGANLLIGGMLTMFIIVLAITTIRGINVSCGCFSTSMAVKSNLLLRIIEDVGMYILFLHIFLFYKTATIQKSVMIAEPELIKNR